MTTYDPGRSEIEELLGAYTLDAVSDDERRLVEELLEASPRARAEVDDFREIASLLAYSGADAPDAVWSGIQDQLDGANVDASVLPLPFERAGSRRTQPSPWLAGLGGAIAAAVLMVVGLVALDRNDEVSPTQQTVADVDGALALAADRAFADERARTASFSIGVASDGAVNAAILENGQGFVRAAPLPALARDRTYQLWGKSGDEIISLSIMGSNPDVIAFEAGSGVNTLMITEEISGGVGQSTNPAIGVAQLS